MKCLLILSVLLIGWCSAEVSLENIPEIPDLDDVAIIKERCDKKGGAGTYEKVKNAKVQVVDCIKTLINVDTIKTEVEKAKKTGSMDEVFGKYCGKRPQITQCLNKVIDAVKPCLEDTEKDALNVTLDILRQLGDFVCYRDGDRIAMFIAEGGIECIQSRSEGIKNCVNATFKINPSTISANAIPNLTIDKKKCEDLGTVQQCVVEELEKCKDSTPANIVDALFKFIKKSACKNKLKRNIFKREIKTIKDQREQFKIKFLEELEATCNKYGNKNAWLHYQEKLTEAANCIKKYPENNTVFTECHRSTSKLLEECMPKDLKYFPSYVLELRESVTSYFSTYQNIMKAEPENTVYLNCFRTLRNTEIASCFCNYFGQEFLIPKEAMCNKTKLMVNCMVDIAKRSCVRDVKIDQLIGDFQAALTKPCKV